MNRLACTCAGAIALALALPLSAGEGLTIHGAWVREMPPVADNAAGYLRIDNATETERHLVAVESEGYARAEIHESIEEDGMARMEHRERLTVPAGGEAVLEPGGYHIMLMGRDIDPPRAGDELELELIFDDGERKTVTAEVARHGPGGDSGHNMEH
ncbi:copper chaperone PCu(A)C [Aquisalimonas lutea]|uniref:copper chaperone PCu(A)C n=1 Tax=Aquisalimonas lutea TaxID=1327750 RepID=UPI0025B297F6|nr:copper chaperone PCu(A)C [Aquisalimonas lutea]MDN3517852.1 copper chaperone PCu(A)C [Aquisalimonas lutea]